MKLSLVEATPLEQFHSLYEQKLDVGVLRRPDAVVPEGITIEPWYNARLVAAVPHEHALAERDTLRVADLPDQPLISYPRDSGIGLYWTIIRLCSKVV